MYETLTNDKQIYETIINHMQICILYLLEHHIFSIYLPFFSVEFHCREWCQF